MPHLWLSRSYPYKEKRNGESETKCCRFFAGAPIFLFLLIQTSSKYKQYEASPSRLS
jgi:hypothetical protein